MWVMFMERVIHRLCHCTMTSKGPSACGTWRSHAVEKRCTQECFHYTERCCPCYTCPKLHHVCFVPWDLGAPWITAVCSSPSDSLFLNRKAMLESFCKAQIDTTHRWETRGGRDGSQVKRMGCCPDGTGFSSQHLRVSSQLSVTPLPRDLMPLSSLAGSAHTVTPSGKTSTHRRR